MSRRWTDELDRTWDIELEVPDRNDPEAVGDTVLVFGRQGTEERWIDVLGPLEEHFAALPDEQLQHALDAASTGLGVLLVDHDGHAWWVRGPEAESMPGRWAVKFSDGTEEHVHKGPLSDDPEALSEDELLELLDEARGNVMTPMDVSQE